MERYRIGKIHISVTNQNDAIGKITSAALAGVGGYICVSNMRMVMYASHTPEYAEVMEKSFMNLPDGMPLTWCARAWGIKTVNRTCGPELFKQMLQSGDKRLKHYLLGDTQDVLDEIRRKYPSANIVGSFSPPFVNVDEFDYEGISRKVLESGANVVWTAMRAPKQDEFDACLLKYLPNVVSVGVGRAFRTSIGEFKDVPNWAKRMGLSGLYLLRGKWWNEIGFYSEAVFSLSGYLVKNYFSRLRGKNPND